MAKIWTNVGGLFFAHPVLTPRIQIISLETLVTDSRVNVQRVGLLVIIITSTADELSGGTNIDDLERP